MCVADEIGTAKVRMEADATGLAGDIVEQTEGQAKKSGVTLGGLLGKGLKVGATAAAGGVAAVLTGAFIKGFSRLSSIDSAKAKLEGLGYTGKTLSGVMDNALASVKGTAFGLDEAVSAVPGLLAAGIQPGKDLEQTLKNMASAATLGGTSFAEVSDVFGDAAAAGRATTDTFNRLEARGIPAMTNIAKSLGVTREEAQKMASSGQISFKQLQDSLTESIGPAALAAGNSFQGMLANTMSALGRLGAEILGPVFDGLKVVMPTLIAAFDGLTAAIGPIMKRLGPIIAQTFADIAAAIAAVNWDQVASVIEGIANAFIDWAPAIIGVTAAIVGLYTAFKVAQGVMLAFQGVMTLVKAVQLGFAAATYGSVGASYALAAATNAQKVAVIAGAAAQKIATAAQWLWNAALTANPIGIIIVAIAALVAALIWFFTQTELGQAIWKGFIDWLVAAWTAVASFFTTLWQGIVTVFSTAWNAIVEFLRPAFEIISTIIRVYIEVWINIFLILAAALKVAWDFIAGIFTAAWEAIVAFVGPIIDQLVLIIQVAVAIVSAFWKTTWSNISKFFTDIWNKIVSFLAPIVARIQTVITVALGVIRGVWSSIWGAISGVFKGIWSGIVGALNSAIATITGVFNGLKDRVLAPLANAASWLVGVGSDIIAGLINGIKGAIGGVIDAIGGVVNGAIDWAKNILKSNSPSKVFDTIGTDLGKGFVNGINSMAGQVQDAVGSMTLGAVEVAGATVSTIPASDSAAPATSTSTFTVAPGAFQLSGPDPYKVSTLVVDKLAERVAV